LRKANFSFVLSVSALCPPACNNSAPTGQIFCEIWYLNVFRKSVEKISVSLKSEKNKDTSYENLSPFMILSRWTSLRMKNVWDKSCR
jgi:hypothetical protein